MIFILSLPSLLLFCRYEKQLAGAQLDALEEEQRKKAESAALAAQQPDPMQAMETAIESS